MELPWAEKGVASQLVLVVKNLPANAGDARDTGLNPLLGRYLGVGHGNPLQYSYLEIPLDRGAWWATVHRVTQSWTWLKQLSMHACFTMFPWCFRKLCGNLELMCNSVIFPTSNNKKLALVGIFHVDHLTFKSRLLVLNGKRLYFRNCIGSDALYLCTYSTPTQEHWLSTMSPALCHGLWTQEWRSQHLC